MFSSSTSCGLLLASCQISFLTGKILLKQYKQKFGFKFVKSGDESSLCSAVEQISAVADPEFHFLLLKC